MKLERKRRKEEERRNRRRETNSYKPSKSYYDRFGNRIKPNGTLFGDSSPTRNQGSTNVILNPVAKKVIQKVS